MIFRLVPERRFNPNLIAGLNQATDVVAEDFAKHFVGLSGGK
jgi:hypothetical protein